MHAGQNDNFTAGEKGGGFAVRQLKLVHRLRSKDRPEGDEGNRGNQGANLEPQASANNPVQGRLGVRFTLLSVKLKRRVNLLPQLRFIHGARPWEQILEVITAGTSG
jgi:hypothetical protein